MLATYNRRWAALFNLLWFLFIPATTNAQGAPTSDLNGSHLAGLSPELWKERCASSHLPADHILSSFAIGGEPRSREAAWDAEVELPRDTTACGPHDIDAASSEMPTLKAQQSPCLAMAAAMTGGAGNLSCAPARDTVSAELSSLGKAGLRIQQVREHVLGILGSENACTAWFLGKEPNPARTFQSLTFSVDLHGQENIFESSQGNSVTLFRQPYVAKAIQDGGAYTEIIINANGAFYRAQGKVQKMGPEVGPLELNGSQLLRVGQYGGNTYEAQIATLLHEFGHIIDLLPEDADNIDGKSVQNTGDVLRHCRTEIEASAKEARHPSK